MSKVDEVESIAVVWTWEVEDTDDAPGGFSIDT